MAGSPAARLSDYLKSWSLYPLPHHLLSRLMLRLTRLRSPALVPPAIRLFVRRFGVDLSEAREPDPGAYPHFNAFFTRGLLQGVRPVDGAEGTIVSPADGTVSQLGQVEDRRIFQAKGREYDLVELLGGDPDRAAPFAGGEFITIYLSPRDYHRVHMPFAGQLRQMVHVPGRLFSVAPHTVRAIPRLFARNERVACLFDTDLGPMALVLVGAIFVASIETTWAGVVTPPRGRRVTWTDYGDGSPPRLAKGEEMGRFNMGSTVILLLPANRIRWGNALAAQTPVRMGQALARRL